MRMLFRARNSNMIMGTFTLFDLINIPLYASLVFRNFTNELNIIQVRQLVIAVRAYTQQPIDVVGYSLGVPVLRKVLFVYSQI
jgi:hypothetical protein